MLSVVLCLVVAAIALLALSYAQTLSHYRRKARVASPGPNGEVREYGQAPGPTPWPVLGNLALLGRYKVPFEGFTQLAKRYGDAYSLTLGSTRCLVVNNLELIREVLNQNGKFFGGRPDFLRYHKLFGGDRNNSLALCDWSQLQQKRRNLARKHCSPRNSSSYFTKMSNVGCLEASELMDRLEQSIAGGEPFAIKPLIQQTCANMFSIYMCSTRFDYDDRDFQQIVRNFDEIFWEINQGYAVDFLPWLAPFYKSHIKRIINWSSTIRNFILERIIHEREQNLDMDEPEKDFTDALLKSLVEDKNVSRETIIYMLEDFIGGHSAVGNLVMLSLAYVARHPHIGAEIQAECDRITNGGQRKISLYDMEQMPYTMATIFEVLRYSSSPIVPHVATEDAVIAGYGVTAGTIVFINNYKLNTSEQYWESPEVFDPQRFLEENVEGPPKGSMPGEQKRRNSEGSDSGVEVERAEVLGEVDGADTVLQGGRNAASGTPGRYQIKKNIPHFLPFSIGKRTCIGQNLVKGFGFILLANILDKYNVSTEDPSSIKISPACVALPADTFPLVFNKRSSK